MSRLFPENPGAMLHLCTFDQSSYCTAAHVFTMFTDVTGVNRNLARSISRVIWESSTKPYSPHISAGGCNSLQNKPHS